MLYVKGKYKKIYAFEPDLANYLLIAGEFSSCRDVIVENVAVGGADGEAVFDMRGTYGSKLVHNKLDNDCFVDVKTIKLDSYINEPVTFIKMDIEGAECEALLGAEETIKEHKPKLAISLYHNDDDLTKIPLLVHKIVPEYRFYLRHHSPLYGDTVLYAKI
jgi:FkbM family methyltransferase